MKDTRTINDAKAERLAKTGEFITDAMAARFLDWRKAFDDDVTDDRIWRFVESGAKLEQDLEPMPDDHITAAEILRSDFDEQPGLVKLSEMCDELPPGYGLIIGLEFCTDTEYETELVSHLITWEKDAKTVDFSAPDAEYDTTTGAMEALYLNSVTGAYMIRQAFIDLATAETVRLFYRVTKHEAQAIVLECAPCLRQLFDL